MKRWIPIGLVLVLVILAFGLCATAWNPGEFSGDWYCAETGELFRFQDGLVSCEQHNLLTGTIDAMCGAYCFDRDSVTVFSLGVAGLENPRQLYLIHGTDGDRLCGSKDGSGETAFRYPNDARRYPCATSRSRCGTKDSVSWTKTGLVVAIMQANCY